MIELTFLNEIMLIKQVHQKCHVCHYWYFLTYSFNPIVHGGGGRKFTPPPVGFFLITFFSLKLRAWNFLTLGVYPLDTMWRNVIKKYWLADKLWHFCHQWLEIFYEEKFFFLQAHSNVFY